MGQNKLFRKNNGRVKKGETDMGFLTGKTAIITGGGRAVLQDGSCGSIGYGIATAYAKEGANLVLTGRNVKKLTDAKEELESKYGIKVLPIQADINAGADNETVVANVVKQTIDEFGRIDVLINNAQASASGVTIADHTTQQFDLAMYSYPFIMRLSKAPYKSSPCVQATSAISAKQLTPSITCCWSRPASCDCPPSAI